MIGSIRLWMLALPLTLTLVTDRASAATITYHWEGIIQDFDVKFPSPDLAVGKRFGIDLILDDSTADSDPLPTLGQYDYNGNSPFGPTPIVVDNTVSGLHYPYHFLGIEEHATVFDNYNGIDGFTISGIQYHGIGNVFTFNFSTPNLGVLTSDKFPTSLDPRDFAVATFSYYGSDPNAHPGFRGIIVAATPLPTSVGLFASALAGLASVGWLGRRRTEPAD
jgi:hypothetical protein